MSPSMSSFCIAKSQEGGGAQVLEGDPNFLWRAYVRQKQDYKILRESMVHALSVVKVQFPAPQGPIKHHRAQPWRSLEHL